MKMLFENVDAHINTALPGTSDQADVKVKGKKLKEIWHVAKPILMLVTSLPIIPAKWRVVLNALITGIDEMHSAETTLP